MAEKTRAEKLLLKRKQEQKADEPKKELSELEKTKQALKKARAEIRELKAEKAILIEELDKYIAAYNSLERKAAQTQQPQAAQHRQQ